MFSLFIELLRFSEPLATKCMFLNDETYMVKPTLIGMNPFELKYYPLVISIDKYTGNYSVLSPKICVPKETKDIYVKAINMLTNKNEAKAMTEHTSEHIYDRTHVIVNANSVVQHVIHIKNGIIKHANVNVKI